MANELIAPVKNGEVQELNSSTSLSTEKNTSNSSLDKEAFLSLLVAEMQYQDPLEPTTNTEYISQFATFSQLEATQDLAKTNVTSMANNLIGKQVIMKVTSNVTGETNFVNGQVDYVYLENGKTYLSIEDQLYSIDDLDSVVDDEYLEAVTVTTAINNELKKLPSSVTLQDEEKLAQIGSAIASLSDYERSFINKDYMARFNTLCTDLAKLKAAQSDAE